MNSSSAIINSILCGIIWIILLATDIGKSLPANIAFAPVGAIGLIWLRVALYKGRLLTPLAEGALSISFGVLFYAFLLPVGLGCIAITHADADKYAPTQTYGQEKSPNHIEVVYHPGLLSFTTSTAKQLSGAFAEKDCFVTLRTARKSLHIDMSGVSLLVLVSPTYFGALRPPIKEFLSHEDLVNVPTAVLKTGLVGKWSYEDSCATVGYLKSFGVNPAGVAGISFLADKITVGTDINDFVEDVLKP
jgi:hypothetical protein